MEEIWLFLQQYGYYICLAFIFLLDIILLIVKKRPLVVDNSIIAKLIPLVLEAEDKYKDGGDKMSYVLSGARDYLGDFYKESDIKALVELLLELPQKKGVQNGTKKS